jgi:hypothetical protein
MLACASAYMNTDAQTLILAAISMLLLGMASESAVMACILARAGGADWQELEATQHSNVLERLLP